VKSVFADVEVLENASAILGTLNFVNLVNFNLEKEQKFINIKIQSL